MKIDAGEENSILLNQKRKDNEMMSQATHELKEVRFYKSDCCLRRRNSS